MQREKKETRRTLTTVTCMDPEEGGVSNEFGVGVGFGVRVWVRISGWD